MSHINGTHIRDRPISKICDNSSSTLKTAAEKDGSTHNLKSVVRRHLLNWDTIVGHGMALPLDGGWPYTHKLNFGVAHGESPFPTVCG